MVQCTRLEQYARWKAKRFPLHRIPDDVFACIAERLKSSDLNSLLEAYFGVKPDISCRESHRMIPSTLSNVWIATTAVDAFSRVLNSFAERAMYHCREFTSVIALIDWSRFSSKPMCPVAEYSWRYPHAQVDVKQERLYGHFISCFQRKTPCVRITLHANICLSQANVVNPDPLMWCTYSVFPYFMIA